MDVDRILRSSRRPHLFSMHDRIAGYLTTLTLRLFSALERDRTASNNDGIRREIAALTWVLDTFAPLFPAEMAHARAAADFHWQRRRDVLNSEIR